MESIREDISKQRLYIKEVEGANVTFIVRRYIPSAAARRRRWHHRRDRNRAVPKRDQRVISATAVDDCLGPIQRPAVQVEDRVQCQATGQVRHFSVELFQEDRIPDIESTINCIETRTDLTCVKVVTLQRGRAEMELRRDLADGQELEAKIVLVRSPYCIAQVLRGIT